jgi:signal transduction histidine kinase
LAATVLPINERERLIDLYRYAILDTPPEEFFDLVTRVAAQLCDAPIAMITLIDHDRQWFKSKIGLEPSQTPRENSFCAHAILGTEPLHVHDTTADPRFANNPFVHGDPYIRFYVGAPLINPRGFGLGSLCVIDRIPRQLSPEQLSSLKLLAAQVVQHLEMRYLAEALRRQTILLDKTQRAAQIGGWELDLNTRSLTWTDKMYRLHGLVRKSYSLTVESSVEFYTSETGPVIRRAVESAIENGTPFEVEGQIVRADGGHRWVRATGTSDGGPGLATVLFGLSQDITERRELEREVVRISDRERSRFGSDLHDGLGQELTGIALMLGALASATTGTASAIRDDVRMIETMVREALGHCRLIAQGLSPTGAEQGGLISALRRHAFRLEKIHGIQFTFHTAGDDSGLDSICADNLYRIAQEAMTNSIKHGCANLITVSFSEAAGKTEFSICDNGNGMTGAPRTDGMGLRVMHYRARLIGGTLEIGPTANGGICVHCIIAH